MKVRIEDNIDYAHRLHNYEGKCKNIHGHTAKIAVEVKGSIDSETGMIIDFSELKSIMKSVLEKLDHKFILYDKDYMVKACNAPGEFVTPFKKIPTAENLSKYIRDQIFEILAKRNCVCTRVEFWETPTNCAIWEIE